MNKQELEGIQMPYKEHIGYAILNVHNDQFLKPVGRRENPVFTDVENLIEFFQDQIDTHDLNDVDHLRVVKVSMAEAVDAEVVAGLDV